MVSADEETVPRFTQRARARVKAKPWALISGAWPNIWRCLGVNPPRWTADGILMVIVHPTCR